LNGRRLGRGDLDALLANAEDFAASQLIPGYAKDPVRQRASGAVLRGGLKNGTGTTLAETVLRAASTVSSMLSVEPKVALSRLMEAKAIMRLSVGDHVVEVALPTWRPAR
jgi:hypothetical protein